MKRHTLAFAQSFVLLSLCSFLIWLRVSRPGKVFYQKNEKLDSPQTLWPGMDTHAMNHMAQAGMVATHPSMADGVPERSTIETGVLLSSPLTVATTFAALGAPSTMSISSDIPPASSSENPPTTTTLLSAQSATNTGNPELFANASVYVSAIMSIETADFEHLSCPSPTSKRYDYLKSPSTRPRYFFAINLHQSAAILPRLMSTVIETIRFLGPENCALSVVEGRSTDGTYEVLVMLEQRLREIGTSYYFDTSDVEPLQEGGDRIVKLAILRDLALQPLYDHPNGFDPATTAVFINDIALCQEDILELIHQRLWQKADVTCAMDWIHDASLFYDVWTNRQMNGELFFEIPQSGSWEYASNLFWNDPDTRQRWEAGKPFQVFSCWNGMVVFTAKPLMEGKVMFRGNKHGECYMGEPVHFASDMWHEDHGRVMVVPSVNVAYSDNQSSITKELRGRVSEWVEKYEGQEDGLRVQWKSNPPQLIKCVANYQHPSWVPWYFEG